MKKAAPLVIQRDDAVDIGRDIAVLAVGFDGVEVVADVLRVEHGSFLCRQVNNHGTHETHEKKADKPSSFRVFRAFRGSLSLFVVPDHFPLIGTSQAALSFSPPMMRLLPSGVKAM